MICVVSTYETAHRTNSYYVISGGGRLIADTWNTYKLKYLYISINFPDSWFKKLQANCVWRFQAYTDMMNEVFKKIPTIMPVNVYQDFKEERKFILEKIWGKWFMGGIDVKYHLFKTLFWSRRNKKIMILSSPS